MPINIYHFLVEQCKVEIVYVYADNYTDAKKIVKEEAEDIEWDLIDGDDYEICDIGTLSAKEISKFGNLLGEIISANGGNAEEEIIKECNRLLANSECDGQTFLDLGDEMNKTNDLLVNSEEYNDIVKMKEAMIKRIGK